MCRIKVSSVLSLALVSLIFSLVSPVATKAQEEARSGGGAQKTERPPEAFGRKIVTIKYADVNQLASILRPLGFADGNRDMRVITIGGSPEAIVAMEEAIKRLDVPPPAVENIELTAYLLVASDQASTKNTPAELEGVIKQLKGVFPYQGYRLMDTLLVRCRNGRAGDANGVAPSNPEDVYKTYYKLGFKSVNLIPDPTGKRIRIDGLYLGVKIPIKSGGSSGVGGTNFMSVDTAINTDLDLREGQRVVVGKATVDSSNNALFLVLTARVVD
jgi:hypothetical protein